MKKKWIIGLLGGLLVAASVIGVTSCNHEHAYTDVVTAPTCTTEGYTTHVCECGDSIVDTSVEALGHKSSPELYGNATSHWNVCRVCYDVINEENHTWNNGVIKLPATFTTTGIKTYTCTICEKTKQEEVPVVEHTCRYSSDWLTDATSHWRECSVCGQEENKEDHTWNSGVVTQEATTTETGLKTYTCTTCEKKKYEDIPIIPHTHDFAEEWSGNDEFHWHACGACDEMNEKAEHLWNEGIVTLPATTTAKGIKTYTCTTCSHVKTEDIAMLPSSNQPIFALNGASTEYVVTGFDGNASEITIPNTYNGLRVTSIAKEAFLESKHVKKLTLPNTIRTIGEAAFKGCSNLTQVNIPESVTSIGVSAFEGCSSLSSLSFATEVNELSTFLTIGAQAFKDCISLSSVSFAKYTKTIGSSAFENCYSLSRITINDLLQNIGSSAFAKCIVLNNVTLNEGLLEVGAFAFDGCEALTSIAFPETVTSVGVGAFRNAKSLATVTLSENMTTIANSTFQNCTSLQEIELHEDISTIGISAFSCCTAMTSAKVLGDVTSIGNNAFYRCEKLSELYLASSTQGTLYNENYIFYNAGIGGAGITLTIGADGYVPHGLFEPIHKANAPKITSIVIEDGATQIRYFTQYNYLPYLTSVTIPDSIQFVHKDVFSNAPNFALTDYEGAKYLGNSNNAYKVFMYPNSLEASSYTLHESTESIADYAFVGCESLTNLTLPNTVENIGQYAFYECASLTNVGRAIEVAFDYNYEGRDPTIVSLTGGQTLSYPTNPSRDGYYFTGWYTSPACTTRYSWSGSLTSDMTLYAGWVEESYNATITNSSYYPWYQSGDVLYSTNKADYSSSTYRITANEYMSFTFQYKTSSESGCDYLYIEKNGSTLKSCSGSTSYVSYTVTLYTGDYLTFTYSKDYSVNSGDDCAYIKGLPTFSSYVEPPVYESTATAVNLLDCIRIDSSAFNGCSSLISVVLGDSVESIGNYAFFDCENLASITFKDTSSWYRTTSYSNWRDKTNGVSVGVSSTSSNASYFTYSYYNYYWYKL